MPVLHTQKITIAFTEMCVRLGLAHSPLAYDTVEGVSYEDFTSFAYK